MGSASAGCRFVVGSASASTAAVAPFAWFAAAAASASTRLGGASARYAVVAASASTGGSPAGARIAAEAASASTGASKAGARIAAEAACASMGGGAPFASGVVLVPVRRRSGSLLLVEKKRACRRSATNCKPARRRSQYIGLIITVSQCTCILDSWHAPHCGAKIDQVDATRPLAASPGTLVARVEKRARCNDLSRSVAWHASWPCA